MERLEASLERAKALDLAEIAEAIQAIGFECTRCGRCCSGTPEDPHTATVFPAEVRAIRQDRDLAWEAVARPMPFGLTDGEGETFEWALQTDPSGDCAFLEGADGATQCTVYGDRPLICQTYPFSLSLEAVVGEEIEDEIDPGDAYDQAVVTESGPVRAHECPGLGTEISRKRATALAETLRERAIQEIEETIGFREAYDPDREFREVTVVHDSEGPKRPTGEIIQARPERSAGDKGEDRA